MIASLRLPPPSTLISLKRNHSLRIFVEMVAAIMQSLVIKIEVQMVQLLAIKMYLEVHMGGKEGTLLAIKMEVQMARLVAIKMCLAVQMSGNERNLPTDL